MLAVLVKNLSEYALLIMEVKTYDNFNIKNLLDIVEILISFYTIYSLYIFTLCLQNGKISEYEPLNKFYWFGFLIFITIFQRFLIMTVGESILMSYLPKNFTDEQQKYLLLM